jgi:hypothetical protein
LEVEEKLEELVYIYLPNTEVHIAAQEARPMAHVLSLESLTRLLWLKSLIYMTQ